MPDIYIAPQPAEDAILKAIKKVGLKPGTGPLSSLVVLPKGYHFDTQDENEQIVLIMRPHWLTNVPWLILALIMLFAPLLLPTLPLLAFLPTRFQLITLLMWYLFLLGFVFEKFLSWFFNLFIVTDHRVIDIDFISLTYREISEAPLTKIQDITYKSGGILRTLVNFGDVFIQTAATVQKIEFESISQPDKVVRIISQLMNQ